MIASLATMPMRLLVWSMPKGSKTRTKQKSNMSKKQNPFIVVRIVDYRLQALAGTLEERELLGWEDVGEETLISVDRESMFQLARDHKGLLMSANGLPSARRMQGYWMKALALLRACEPASVPERIENETDESYLARLREAAKEADAAGRPMEAITRACKDLVYDMECKRLGVDQEEYQIHGAPSQDAPKGKRKLAKVEDDDRPY